MTHELKLLQALANQCAPSAVKIRIHHPRGVAEQADLLTSTGVGGWSQREISFVHPECVQRLMWVLEQRSQQSEPLAVQRWKDVTEYHCPVFGESVHAAHDPIPILGGKRGRGRK
jgi:hypothetical protein